MTRNRHEHSVLTVTTVIHGHAKGTCDGYDEDQLRDLVRWLQWRVGRDGWEKSDSDSGFDAAVRELAYQALAEWAGTPSGQRAQWEWARGVALGMGCSVVEVES